MRLTDELRAYDIDLADTAQPECEALAEAYFAERYPGFDMEDPDWTDFAERLEAIRKIVQIIESRIR